MVYKVCASAVISLLRQWLDSYAKTRLKMWHTFKHFIHMQYFSLPTNLVIVFVHWVGTGVLYEPRQCSLFWDYIPELCFCLNLCRPPGTHSTSTVYWCIASKLKASRNLYWMSNMFLWVVYFFSLCDITDVVPKRHSQLDYESNGL